MDKIKALIIDDEDKGRETLINFIGKYCDSVEIIGEASSVVTGFKQIQKLAPELVFLDIQMQDGTGFDLLEMLPEKNFHLIFVTSYDQYALKAFRFSALDYLLKPVDPDMLKEAVDKAAKEIGSSEQNEKFEILSSNKDSFEKIALPSSEGVRFVKISTIVRCESDSNYTRFYLDNKEKILVSKTLKEFDELLTPLHFYRTHKSHLVNLHFIDKYIPGEGGYLILEDGSHIEVSRRKKEGLMALLMK
jgi:two-component system LytT family response regulator